MNRALPVAACCALVAGLGTYWLVVPDWYVALGTGAVYAGVGYFYAGFDVSLRDRSVRFDDRTDRLGYAVGLFGLGVSPLAFAHHYEVTPLPFVVLSAGTVAFLLLVSRVRQQTDAAR
ncbi:MAG: hypothetical protein ABEJ34_01120 [Haloferacaceae archaeon]